MEGQLQSTQGAHAGKSTAACLLVVYHCCRTLGTCAPCNRSLGQHIYSTHMYEPTNWTEHAIHQVHMTARAGSSRSVLLI